MHNEDIERPTSRDDDSTADGVIAADDTGMVEQQEILVRHDVDEAMIGDAETGLASEAEGA